MVSSSLLVAFLFTALVSDPVVAGDTVNETIDDTQPRVVDEEQTDDHGDLAPVADESTLPLSVDDRAPPILDAAPPDDVAPEPPVIDPCRDDVTRGEVARASQCYRRQVPADVDDARRLDERVRTLDLIQAPQTSLPRFTLQSFLLSGRPEFVLGSAVHGAIAAPLALAAGGYWLFAATAGRSASLGQSPLVFAAASSTAIASPLLGGTLGLVGSALLVLTPGLLSDGDADFLRSSLVVGAFEVALLYFYTTSSPRPFFEPDIPGSLWPAVGSTAALTLSISPVIIAGALVALVDVPEGAGSAGLSAGALATVLTLLTIGAVDVPLDPWITIALVAAASHAAFASMVGLSFFYPFQRMSTWMVDLGAFAGLLLSAALVLGIPAGNPVTGYGGMAVGMMTGALGGLLLSELVPFVVEALPSLDEAITVPLMLPSLDGRSVGMGMALVSPFESSPLVWR